MIYYKDINALDTNKIIELSEKYFEGKESKYTDEIVLDLVFKELLKKKTGVISSYDGELGSLEANEKIIINNINEKTANNIRSSLDYTCIVGTIDDGDLGTNLRELVINVLYKNILVEQLKLIEKRDVLQKKSIHELQKLAIASNHNFNKIIHLLTCKIESLITVRDFNSMSISWILVSYFFEICDVGLKKNDSTN